MSAKQQNNQNAVKLVPKPHAALNTSPPDDFTEEQIAVWDEIISNLDLKVVSKADHAQLAILACLECEYRKDRITFPLSKLQFIAKLYDKFGASPAGRANIKHAKTDSDDKKKNKFSGF